MTYNEYLAHHGIPGMKWGKRNGPPYPLTISKMSSAERKAKSDSKKSPKEMSDEELNKAINRLRKENEYKSLVEANKTLTGKKWVDSYLESSGNVATKTLGAKTGGLIAKLALAGAAAVAAYIIDLKDLFKNGVFP